jgi:hypothetical protein
MHIGYWFPCVSDINSFIVVAHIDQDLY